MTLDTSPDAPYALVDRFCEVRMRLLRASCVLSAAVAVATLVACRGTPSDEACREPRFDLSVAADSGWLATIITDLQSSPDTAQVSAVFFFVSGVTEQDRQLLASIGASIQYEFRGFPAVSVRISVGDLRAFASNGAAERVTNVQIPARIYPTECD
jgi:hypothetical protein